LSFLPQSNFYLNIVNKGNIQFWLFPLLFLGIAINSESQNLILNGSFEEYSSCPNKVGEIDKTINWVSLNSGTPDFFHKNCDFSDSIGSIENGSLGLIVCCDYEDAVEYFGQTLQHPLEKGNYILKFKVKPRAGPFYANNFGVLLRKGQIKLSHWGPYIEEPIFKVDTPLIQTKTWKQFEVEIETQGGEDFIAFGNFSLPEENNLVIDKTQKITVGWQTYLYVDDIVLEKKFSQKGAKAVTQEFTPNKSLSVYFDFDKYELKPNFKDSIDAFIELHNTSVGQTIILKGFTDSDGSEDYNYTLSVNRIEEVKSYLVSSNKKFLFQQHAFGEENPKFSNADKFEKPKNRRVEILFFKP